MEDAELRQRLTDIRRKWLEKRAVERKEDYYYGGDGLSHDAGLQAFEEEEPELTEDEFADQYTIKSTVGDMEWWYG